MEAYLQVINDKGAGLGVSQEKILEVTESAQKVGLHLKTCCKVLDKGKLNANQFQQCIDKAAAYEKQAALVARRIQEVTDIKETGTTAVPPGIINSIHQAIESAIKKEKSLALQVQTIQPLDNGDIDKERESNNQITAANTIQVGERIRGAIASDQDRDYFRFTTSGREPGKTRIIVRKLSTGGFATEVHVYDHVENHIKGLYDYGGDHPISFAFESTPDSDYYILVKAHSRGHQGPYELEVREE